MQLVARVFRLAFLEEGRDAFRKVVRAAGGILQVCFVLQRARKRCMHGMFKCALGKSQRHSWAGSQADCQRVGSRCQLGSRQHAAHKPEAFIGQ